MVVSPLSTAYKYLLIFVCMERINRIKEVLVIKGVSQKELAAKLGKNPNSIASICNNKSQPHLKDLKKIAEILDIDIRELLVPTKEK
jgi:transcriptional regulator with XRE-family HTH domain